MLLYVQRDYKDYQERGVQDSHLDFLTAPQLSTLTCLYPVLYVWDLTALRLCAADAPVLTPLWSKGCVTATAGLDVPVSGHDVCDLTASDCVPL